MEFGEAFLARASHCLITFDNLHISSRVAVGTVTVDRSCSKFGCFNSVWTGHGYFQRYGCAYFTGSAPKCWPVNNYDLYANNCSYFVWSVCTVLNVLYVSIEMDFEKLNANGSQYTYYEVGVFVHNINNAV